MTGSGYVVVVELTQRQWESTVEAPPKRKQHSHTTLEKNV